MELAHFTEQVGTIRIHYVSQGEGPLVVLLHGFPEFWWSWRHQLPLLADARFRAVAPDLRGYNDTDRTGPYDLDTLSGDVVNLIGHLGAERATIVGHDWGGVIAWYLAAKHPDVCERVVVLNAPHPAVFAHVIRSNPRRLQRSWYMFFFVLPWLPEARLLKDDARIMHRIYRANAVNRSAFSDEVVRPFREAILKPGAAAAALGYYRAAIWGGFSQPRQLSGFPLIKQPALLLWGRNDTALSYEDLVPPTVLWATDLWIEPIEGAGHFVHQERPTEVNQALMRFLWRPGSSRPP